MKTKYGGAHCVPFGTPAGQPSRRVPAAKPPERAPPLFRTRTQIHKSASLSARYVSAGRITESAISFYRFSLKTLFGKVP